MSPSIVISYPSLPNLTEAASVAIWNKNKFIVGITAAVSLTNVGVIVLGKSFSQPTDFRSGISYKRDFAPGIMRVMTNPNWFDNLDLSLCRSALNGTLFCKPVSSLIPRKTCPTLSSFSFPTSSYFSLYSLDCSLCVMKAVLYSL